MRTTPLVCPKNCDGGRGNRDLTHKKSLHADLAVGKLLLQCFLGAFRAYERAGVKNFTKKIFRRKSRVDTTLAFEFVVGEIKPLKLNTITQWNWDRSCQKNRPYKNSRLKCTRMLHLPWSLLEPRWRNVKLIQLHSETGISPVKKNDPSKFEAKMYTDHTLTRKLVVTKPKLSQLGTIPKWFRNLTCQKKWIKEIWGRPVARIIHLPSSLLSLSKSCVKLTQLPSETGIWPVKKNELKKFEGDL